MPPNAVPDAPQVNFIPVYSNESQVLVKLIVEISKMVSNIKTNVNSMTVWPTRLKLCFISCRAHS